MTGPPGSVALDPWTDVRSRQDVEALDIPFPYGRMPDEFAVMMRRAYLAAIAYTDHQIGEVIAGVEKAGMTGNTIGAPIAQSGPSCVAHC